MTRFAENWVPSDLYRATADHAKLGERSQFWPISQGDVFENVPIASPVNYQPLPDVSDRANEQFKATTKRMHAIVVTHACSMRKGDELETVLIVAPVFLRRKRAKRWEAPWNGCYFLFPLPGIGGDDYVADLSRCQPIRTDYLSERIAILSESGAEALAARLSYFYTRTEPDDEALRAHNERQQSELRVWAFWHDHTGAILGFQDWLHEFDAELEETRADTLPDKESVLLDTIRQMPKKQ